MAHSTQSGRPTLRERDQPRAGTDAYGRDSDGRDSDGRHRDERPLESYALLMAVYSAIVGVLLIGARRRGRLPATIALRDLALVAAATQRLSRLITKDRVASPVRAPFTAPQGNQAAPREVSDAPRGRGLRRVIGELLVCPFCISQWIATAFAVGLLFAPRSTRWIAAVFATVAGSDFLQFAYRIAEREAIERR